MVTPRFDRRDFLVFATGAALSSCTGGPRPLQPRSLGDAIAALEGRGRLGVAVLDTGTGHVDGYRLDERFALCSTFKLVLAAAVLARAAAGTRPLDATVRVTEADLIHNAPVTRSLVEAAAARGERAATVDLATLAHGMQTTSDGAAANLLLRDLGGLAAFRDFCRAHGDTTTRLDRFEPDMNAVHDGDERDTTTPRAMAQLVARLMGEGGLPAGPRRTLRQWLIETATGAARIRAGLPADWIAGDKTGTGGGGPSAVTVKVNDVVWAEPPGRAPLVVAAYYETYAVAEWPTAAQEAVLADVGRLVAAHA